MSSEVDICNLALAHLGDEAGVAAIVPPDGTVQAAHCGRFYPMVRDLLIEAHPWTFAIKRAVVSEVTNPSPDDWAYAYTLPSGCLRPLSFLLPGHPEQMLGTDSDMGSHPYIVEAAEDGTAVLYSNVPAATLRYLARVTDTTKFSPGFVASLARLLAAYLAGPIVKGKEGVAVAKAQMQIFTAEFAQAAARNANVGKRSSYMTRSPAWIAGRGLPALPESYVTE